MTTMDSIADKNATMVLLQRACEGGFGREALDRLYNPRHENFPVWQEDTLDWRAARMSLQELLDTTR